MYFVFRSNLWFQSYVDSSLKPLNGSESKKGRKTGKRKKDNFRRRTNLSKDDYSSIRKGGGAH